MQIADDHQGYYVGNKGVYDHYKDIDYWDYDAIDFDLIHRVRVNNDILDSHNDRFTKEQIEWCWIEGEPLGIDWNRFGQGEPAFFVSGTIDNNTVHMIGRRMYDGGIMVWHADLVEHSQLEFEEEVFAHQLGQQRKILERSEQRCERNYGKRRYRRIMNKEEAVGRQEEWQERSDEEVLRIIREAYSTSGWMTDDFYLFPAVEKRVDEQVEEYLENLRSEESNFAENWVYECLNDFWNRANIVKQEIRCIMDTIVIGTKRPY